MKKHPIFFYMVIMASLFASFLPVRSEAQNSKILTDRYEADKDFLKVGTAEVPYSITDEIYTMGKVGINQTTPAVELHAIGRAILERATDSLTYGYRTDILDGFHFRTFDVDNALLVPTLKGLGGYVYNNQDSVYTQYYIDYIGRRPTMNIEAVTADSTAVQLTVSPNGVFNAFSRIDANTTSQIRIDGYASSLQRSFSGGSASVVVGTHGSFGSDLIKIDAANVWFPDYPNTRDNTSTVENFLFTDVAGILKSRPIDELPIHLTEYTPSSAADPFGDPGRATWDDDYIYIKTNTGWKRMAISSWP